jgi:hypothetical protein
MRLRGKVLLTLTYMLVDDIIEAFDVISQVFQLFLP